MRLISFSMTEDAYRDGSKTVTRRAWKPNYAAQWKKGDLFMGVEKLRVKNPNRLGVGRLTCDPYLEALRDMPDDHFEREGGTQYWNDRDDFIEIMGGPDKELWVIEFERVGDK